MHAAIWHSVWTQDYNSWVPDDKPTIHADSVQEDPETVDPEWLNWKLQAIWSGNGVSLQCEKAIVMFITGVDENRTQRIGIVRSKDGRQFDALLEPEKDEK